jgi:DNA repair protein RecN (Recombination protein N)
MGGRARPQIVRPGAGEAYVEGVFATPPALFDDPDLAELAARLPHDAEELVLARRISSSGRTTAFVQGRSASAADLRALGSRLLTFYGQHEHRRLVLSASQMAIVDGFAGVPHLELRGRYAEAHAAVVAAERELAELREREGGRERELDLRRFELAEIEAVAPEPEEEAEAVAERDRLRHADRLHAAAAGAAQALGGDADTGIGGARSLVAEAEDALSAAAGVDSELDAIGERLRSAALELDDAAASVRRYADGLESDPGRLAVLEERLDALDRLKRKHGGSIDAVLAHAEECRVEIAALEGAAERAGELETALGEALRRREELAAKLTAGRRNAATALEERAAGELAELAMEGARLEVGLVPNPGGAGPGGAEAVEIRVATNPGLAPSPLRDAASGGELSRVMLALTVLGGGERRADETTLAFDEIDAGIGGRAARAVGERLRALGEDRQVLCITHLPQVASLAHAHFRVDKRVAGGATVASVERLEGDELVAEICRMLGSDAGDEAAASHARELLRAA